MKQILQRYLSEHLLISVIILNIVYLAFNLLFYDPVWQPDDYFIAADIYGAYLGEYNGNPIYTSALYGHLVAFFLNICGSLPWYTILSYAWVFMSLCLLSYVILSYNKNRITWFIVNIVILFFSFEGYMCMQWTKTSAIAMAVGMFVLVFPTSNKGTKVLATILFLIGAFIRTGNLLMIAGAWGVTFGILFIYYALNKKYSLCKESVTNAIKVVVLFVAVYLFLYVSNAVLVEKTEKLDAFNQWSSYRVTVQDYGIPPYDENKEIYEKYGIIEEDLKFIYQWGFDVYNYELYEKVALAKEEILQKEISQAGENAVTALLKKCFDAFHVFPMSFLKMDVFYCYLILVIVLLSCAKNKNGVYFVEFTFLLLLGLNVYLFIEERYLKHRVDVGVVFTICLILLYLFMHERNDFAEKSINKKIVLLILLFLIITPARMFTDDRDTVPKEDILNNKIFYANTTEDEHFYLFVNTRNYNDKKSYGFDIYDVPQKGLMKNTFGLIMATPQVQNAIEALGVEEPYLDVIDGEGMYLATGESNDMLQETLKYIEKKSGKSVSAVCVKKLLGKSIYRVNSKDITDVYEFANITEDISDVKEDLQVRLKKNSLKLSGSVYIDDENDFYQNVYIDVVDSQTEKHQLYYTLQKRNEKFKTGDSGWCSNISAKIELPDFYDENDAVYLMIETLDTTYKYRILN